MWRPTCNYNTCTRGRRASFLILLMMGAWHPKHVEWLCRNKTCTVLHKVDVLFDLYYDARKHKGKITDKLVVQNDFKSMKLLELLSIGVKSFTFIQVSDTCCSIYIDQNFEKLYQQILYTFRDRVCGPQIFQQTMVSILNASATFFFPLSSSWHTPCTQFISKKYCAHQLSPHEPTFTLILMGRNPLLTWNLVLVLSFGPILCINDNFMSTGLQWK